MSEKKSSVVERRAHPRMRTELEVQGTPEAGGGVVARMVTSDLSVGGLLCVSTADFPEMTRLAVRLMLPCEQNGSDTEAVDVEAVVVRREAIRSVSGEPRFELALFFTNLRNGAREQLTRYLGG